MTARFISLLSCLILFTGCASSQQTLNVQRDHSDQSYIAHFDRAYFTEAVDGQLELVLLSDGAGSEASINKPLTTRSDHSVRQIVHVRVLWQHPKGIRNDNPSASNAMINWYVLASPTDRLIYGGACWAKVSVDDDEAEIDLRNAGIAIGQIVGNMQDPLKRATLEGGITARRADATVRSYLEELESLNHHQDAALFGSPNRQATTP